MVQPTVTDDGDGTTATVGVAAATVTCTGMVTETPVPVRVTVPLYVPAAVKDAVLNAIDKLPVFDRLKLVAESPIHD